MQNRGAFSDPSIQFMVDDSCSCHWLEGEDKILVVPKNQNGQPENISMLISFDFKKCLDPDGGHEWLTKRLKRLIAFLVKNKTYFAD